MFSNLPECKLWNQIQNRHAPRVPIQPALLARLEPKELKGHGGCVNRLAWNKTGSLLASGSDDRRVRIWDRNTLKTRTELVTGHQANVFGVAFSPDVSSPLAPYLRHATPSRIR